MGDGFLWPRRVDAFLALGLSCLAFMTPSFLAVVLEALVLFMGLLDFIPWSSWGLLLNLGDSFSLP